MELLLFDIGANRGDATAIAREMGYKVIALEPAPKTFAALVKTFIYDDVIPLRLAVSDKDDEEVEFYDCVEDGLSTIEKDWLTKDGMPYAGKEYTIRKVNTITIDTLVGKYGVPNLIKIDVEGAEWAVFRGMSDAYGTVTFEWTLETIKEHEAQLDYLYTLGYREMAPQYIVEHLQQPDEWFQLKEQNKDVLIDWVNKTKDDWTQEGWKKANLRPTADVGMLWLR